MKSLTIKTVAVTIAVVASGLSLSAFSAHQTKIKNDKIVAEVTEMANKATSDLDEILRRAELGLVNPTEAAMRCDAGNDKACDMVVKYTLVRVNGDSPHPVTDAPSPIIEAREKCSANGSESDACIELSLLEPILDEHNQKVLEAYQ